MKIYVLLSHIPVLVSILYAAFSFHKLGRHIRIFCSFLLLSGLVQLVSLVLWFKQVNNLPLLHFYVPLGLACLTFFYHSILKSIINRYILWGLLCLFMLFSIINTLFIQPINTYNSYALTVESILIVIYSLSSFIFMLNSIPGGVNAKAIKSLNWINSGLFIYYTSSLLIFYFGSILAVHSAPAIARYAWAMHAFFSVTMYVFFTIGLWKEQHN
ncbi:MAG: hypothetical protein V4658_05425 [Bacteroidota bacterium]